MGKTSKKQTGGESSKDLASLAGKVLADEKSSALAKKLAASVLTQAPDKKPPKKTGKKT